jgi:phosphoribosylformylglycinamidine (FGAM) synthase-like enzyme
MCFAGELGAAVDLAKVLCSGCTIETELLFSESQCRILVEVDASAAARFEALFVGLPLAQIGSVVKGDMITFKGLDGSKLVSVSRIDLKNAWKSTLDF